MGFGGFVGEESCCDVVVLLYGCFDVFDGEADFLVIAGVF